MGSCSTSHKSLLNVMHRQGCNMVIRPEATMSRTQHEDDKDDKDANSEST